jgi:putative hydrolase of the HAD superfamily
MDGQPRYRFLLCDLDNTLYPPDSGVMSTVGRLISRYMVERVGIPLEEVDALKGEYYGRYGTTMCGLMLNYGIDPDDYLAYVHDMPLGHYIGPNPDLDAMLASIPLRKAVFTNSDREHAGRVLDTLEVRHHFERIIDVRDFGFYPKPHQDAYLRTLEILKAQADECFMVEDAAPNLAPAKAMGMATVLVVSNPESGEDWPDAVDFRIPDILDLAGAIRPWVMAHS